MGGAGEQLMEPRIQFGQIADGTGPFDPEFFREAIKSPSVKTRFN
jgi:hypothetical protein